MTLIDALYEARVHIDCHPQPMCRNGSTSKAPAAFEFERTASRLREMQDKDWAARDRMIIRDRPRFIELFMVTRGSVVPRIAPNILATMFWAILMLLLDRFVLSMPRMSIGAMGVFGLALSLFLSFRNSAAYDRWWEAPGPGATWSPTCAAWARN